MMKRFLTIGLALVLVFALGAAAAEEADTSFVTWFDAWEHLFFGTRNVTLDGSAEFMLDGEWFKTAKGHYVQDGMDSFWKLDLSTPRKNGAIQETGFTIISNAGTIFVMEPYTPGIYRTGSDMPQSTVLRNSVQTQQLVGLARTISGPLVPTLGDSLRITDTELRLSLNAKSTPPMLNSLFNVIAQYAVKRFFGVDYDFVEIDYNDIYNVWMTPAQQIIHSSGDISLQEAEIRMTLKDGLPDTAEAKFTLGVTFTDGTTHQLSVSFSGNVSGYGESHVDTFDPEAYGVVPANGYTPANEMVSGSAVDTRTIEFLEKKASDIMQLAGSSTEPPLKLPVWRIEDTGWFLMEFGSDDETVAMMEFGSDEIPYSYTRSDLLAATGEGIYENFPVTAEEFAPIEEKLLQFIEAVDPETRKRVSALQITWYCDDNGEVYLQAVEKPVQDDHSYVTFVVRVSPDWEIIHYSSYSNG